MSDTHTSLPGGWSPWHFTLTHEAEAAFTKALHGLVGVHYTPLAFATQVVAGTNYSVLAKGVIAAPGSPEIAVKIHIFQPLPGQGDPHLLQIIRIEP